MLMRMAKWLEDDTIPASLKEEQLATFRLLPLHLDLPVWYTRAQLSPSDTMSGLLLHVSVCYPILLFTDVRIAEKDVDDVNVIMILILILRLLLVLLKMILLLHFCFGGNDYNSGHF